MSETLPRRKVLNVVLIVVVAVGLIGTMAGVMASCTGDGKGKTRALSDSELQLLSRMRMNNLSDGAVAIKAQVGTGSRLSNIDGWVDWKRNLLYFSAYSPSSNALVQARPGVIAIRPGDPAKPVTGSPPEIPPADGWRVRPLSFSGEDKAPLDNLIAFLFLMAHDQPDRADLLKSLQTQWVRRDNANGTEVDVLLGPAVIPQTAPSTPSPQPLTPQATPDPSASPSPTEKPADPLSLEANGGAVGYWLDADARLHKVETFLGKDMSTVIEFTRGAKSDFVAVDALGGREIAPRAVSDPEATLISAMRQRDYRARGAEVTVTLPVLPGALRKAKGWLDWQRGVVYLSVRDIDDPSHNVFLHATQKGVALRPAGEAAPEFPPMPPARENWEKAQWGDLSGTEDLTDLDVLVFEVLGMGVNKLDDVKRIKEGARRLRVDVLNGVPVGVFELEATAPPGQARLR